MTLRSRMEAITADITTLPVDAIVNAANAQLLPGGGVDGAIRHAAGPELTRETDAIGGCPTGMAVLTHGYRLPAKFVIHTAAPRWSGNPLVDGLLKRCYRNCLKIAAERKLRTLAFPCIGTGIYGWPPVRAATIAFETVKAHLAADAAPEKVIFCCFAEDDCARYQTLIAAMP